MGNKSSKKSQPKENKTSTNSKTLNMTLPKSDWLIVGGDFSIKLFENCFIDDLNGLYKGKKMKTYKLFLPNYAELNDTQLVFDDYDDTIIPRPIKGTYEYYRKIAAYSSQNPCVASITSNSFFIFAQYYRNTISNKIIPESLRLSLLSNLSKLAQDNTVKYDIRDASTGQYLYNKIKRFGITELLINKPWENMLKRDWISNDYDVETKYDINNDCMTYYFKDINSNKIPNINTAFIHDLIDPNKYLFENKLWIPTIFDCTKEINNKHFNVLNIIKSPILGLDYIKYKLLYEDIAKIFKIIIQPMFENILNYKLGCNEKIIIKSMKYILQKPGDCYKGNIHREGMGENIIGVAIYYPQITSKTNGLKNGKLKLSIPDIDNKFLKCGGKEFEIEEGSCIVFSNQGLHQVNEINYSISKYSNKVITPISRTILTFFIVNRYNSDDVNILNNENGYIVNLAFYWKYYILYWIRIYKFHNNNNEWFIQLIYKYLFEEQFDDYIYYKRHEQRTEKGKPLIEQILPDDSANWTGEEMFYVDANYDS
eukprot:49695_1